MAEISTPFIDLDLKMTSDQEERKVQLMDINFFEDLTSSDGHAGKDESLKDGATECTSLSVSASTLSTSTSSSASSSIPSFSPSRPSSRNAYNADDKRLFVGNLSYNMTEPVLRDYFSKFGAVFGVFIHFNMLHSPFDKKADGYGYAFVLFEKAETVAKVLAYPTSHVLCQRIINTKIPNKSTRALNDSRCRKLFVGGITQDITAEDLIMYFSRFAKVEDVNLVKDHQDPDRHKGYAFIAFESENIVQWICRVRYRTIKGKKIDCKRAGQSGDALAPPNPPPPPPPCAPSWDDTSMLKSQMYLSLAAAQALSHQGTVPITADMIATTAAHYSRLLGMHNRPPIGNFRYAPYPRPMMPLMNGANLSGPRRFAAIPHSYEGRNFRPQFMHGSGFPNQNACP